MITRERLEPLPQPGSRMVELRTGVIETESLMLGLVGPDGRIRRIDQLTRTLPADQRGCVQRHGQRAARYR